MAVTLAISGLGSECSVCFEQSQCQLDDLPRALDMPITVYRLLEISGFGIRIVQYV